MPIEVLNSNNEESTQEVVVAPEIISQHIRYILGAKLEHADFQFIARDDDATFAALPEGAFGTDVDESGLNKVFRKINGERRYLAYEKDTKAYVTQEIEALKPIVVKGTELPAATEEKPLYEGRTLIFLTSGVVDGREVEAGGTAYVVNSVEQGNKVTWDNLEYNEPTSGIEVAPIELRGDVRLDGSAGSEGVTEKAVADAIIDTRDRLNSQITDTKEELSSRISDAEGRISGAEASIQENGSAIASLDSRTGILENETAALRSENQVQDGRLDFLESKPVLVEETITIGNSVDDIFKVALSNKFINTPILIWKVLMSGSYVRISPQDGDVSLEDGACYLKAAFAGTPSRNQFKVTVQGLVEAPQLAIEPPMVA